MADCGSRRYKVQEQNKPPKNNLSNILHPSPTHSYYLRYKGSHRKYCIISIFYAVAAFCLLLTGFMYVHLRLLWTVLSCFFVKAGAGAGLKDPCDTTRLFQFYVSRICISKLRYLRKSFDGRFLVRNNSVFRVFYPCFCQAYRVYFTFR